ncbi:hypothetical protein C8R45DRAFT_804972, partial [Mycena sanguinolenta]
SMHTFILACIFYPQWIPHAQKEIDAIVGEDRPPCFNNRSHLHMLRYAFLCRIPDIIVTRTAETFRWRPPGRFGSPHQSTADDVVEYKGKEYLIPKGSIVFAVPWS